MLRKFILILLTLVVVSLPIVYPSTLPYILYGYGTFILCLIAFDLFVVRRLLNRRLKVRVKHFKCPMCKKKSFRVKYATIHTCAHCKKKFVFHKDKKIQLLEEVEMDYYEAVLRLIHYVINRDDTPSESQPEFLERLTHYLVNKDQDMIEQLSEKMKIKEELNLRRILFELKQHNLPYLIKESLVKVLLDLSTLDHPINPNVYRAIKKVIHYYNFSPDKYERLKNELSKRNGFPLHLDLYNVLFNRLVTCSDHPKDFDFGLIRTFYSEIGFEQRFINQCEERIQAIDSKKRLYIVAKQIHNRTKSKVFSLHLYETILRFLLRTQSLNRIQERDMNQIKKALKITNEESQLVKQSILMR